MWLEAISSLFYYPLLAETKVIISPALVAINSGERIFDLQFAALLVWKRRGWVSFQMITLERLENER